MLASYAQLEAAWINAGGPHVMAPIMAAIALAESHPPGRTDVADTHALNPNDNNGTQSSYGAWQISNGTHAPPAANWNDLNENAKLAVDKFHSQGLGAWGTYTSGLWRQFYKTGVAPSSSGIHTTSFDPSGLIGGTVGNALGLGGLAGVGGAVTSGSHILGDVANPEWWKRIGKGGIGGALIIAGVYLMMRQQGIHPVQATVKAGEKAAAVAAVIPK